MAWILCDKGAVNCELVQGFILDTARPDPELKGMTTKLVVQLCAYMVGRRVVMGSFNDNPEGWAEAREVLVQVADAACDDDPEDGPKLHRFSDIVGRAWSAMSRVSMSAKGG